MHKRHLYRQSGVLMIEVLITILVTTLGLLGIAALFAKSQQMSDEAYQRYQALDIAHQLAEVISINRTEAALNGASHYVTAAPLSIDTPFDATGLSAAVVEDLTSFRDALIGAQKTTTLPGVSLIPSLIAARGCVDFLPSSATDPPRYRISVAWQGRQRSAATPAPSDEADCTSGFYGDESQRVVSLEVQVL